MRHRLLLLSLVLAVLITTTRADDASKTDKLQKQGTLILGGGAIQGPGDGTKSVKQRFVELAGGPDANFVIIHGNHDTLPIDMMCIPDVGAARAFGVKQATGLCTLKREISNTEEFVAPIRKANAVWITGGKVRNLEPIYRDTLVQKELKALLDRGGVVGGESAGAIILASHITDSIKVAPGQKAPTDCYAGFGFVSDVVIAPHIIKMGWVESLVPIVTANPNLLGLGIDERAAIVVQGQSFEVIGESKVAVYDNADHDGKRYYFLSPGDRFDLTRRRTMTVPSTKPSEK